MADTVSILFSRGFDLSQAYAMHLSLQFHQDAMLTTASYQRVCR